MDKSIIFWSGGTGARGKSTLSGPTIEAGLTSLCLWINAQCDMQASKVDEINSIDQPFDPITPAIPIAQKTIFILRDEDGRIHKYKMPLLKSTNYTLEGKRRVVLPTPLASFAVAMSTSTGYSLDGIKGWAYEN